MPRKTYTKPYTAIPNYLEKTPEELACPGGPMEYSARFTHGVVSATGLLIADLFIDETEVERWQAAGPAVVVPNHRSFLDLTAIGKLGEMSGEGQPYFLSKRENMNNRISAKVYGKMRTFPIDRDMPGLEWQTALIRWCRFAVTSNVKLQKEAMKLVIFGEGERKKGRVVDDMFSGPLVAAKKNRVPILPIGIAGTDGVSLLNGRPSVVVAVGMPYEVSSIRDKELMIKRTQEQVDRAYAILEELTS